MGFERASACRRCRLACRQHRRRESLLAFGAGLPKPEAQLWQRRNSGRGATLAGLGMNTEGAPETEPEAPKAREIIAAALTRGFLLLG